MAPHSTRKAVQMAERRKRVAEMYRDGKMMSEIAEVEGVNVAQISRDVKAIRAEWRSSTLIDFAEAQNRELARLDAVEAEYWQAWKDSRKERAETQTSKAGGVARASIKRVPRDGNPIYLEGVRQCVADRCKILGLYAPTRNEHTGKDGGPLHIVMDV